jgi:signal transduction histidine kinase
MAEAAGAKKRSRGAWPGRQLRYILVLAVATIASFALILVAYRRATNDAVVQLYAQERILARQAASGIGDYFGYLQDMLRFLSTVDSVRDMSDGGKDMLRSFFRTHAEDLASVSRVDERGTLSFTFPYESTAGRSLVSQAHVARFLSRKTAVLSELFTSVQGFPAIALYSPVGGADEFKGGLAVLVPFERISRRYFQAIVLGKKGYGILLDSRGSILYSPVAGMSGRTIFEESPHIPTMGAIITKVLAGEEGTASFIDPETGVRDYVYYAPVRIADASWAVLVRASETEAIGFITGFRNTWFALTALLFAVFGIWAFLLMRSFARLGKANENLLASNALLGDALAELSSMQARLVHSGKMAALGQVTASIAHQFNTPLGAILSANGGIVAALRDELLPALRFYAALPPGLRSRFDALMEGAQVAMSSPPERRLHVDRAAIDELEARLSAAGEAEALELAESLAEMGAIGDIDAAVELAACEEGPAVIRAAAALSGALGSAMLVKYAAEKASGTVSALRTYVRADRAEERSLIELGDELDLLLALYVETPRNNVRIVRRYGDGIRVRGVPDRLSQIWVNIIDNAMHSMKGRGTLEIDIGREGAKAVVVISDSGPGIPAEVAPRIFEPFFTTKPQGDGSGIGLDLARGIAREHGGDIVFESVPGRTRFIVTLPAAD